MIFDAKLFIMRAQMWHLKEIRKNQINILNMYVCIHGMCRGDDQRYYHYMMTLSNGNIFRVIGPLWGRTTGHRWIPITKASDAELCCFLWSAPEQTAKQTLETLVIWDTIALVMTSLFIASYRRTGSSLAYEMSCWLLGAMLLST